MSDIWTPASLHAIIKGGRGAEGLSVKKAGTSIFSVKIKEWNQLC